MSTQGTSPVKACETTPLSLNTSIGRGPCFFLCGHMNGGAPNICAITSETNPTAMKSGPGSANMGIARPNATSTATIHTLAPTHKPGHCPIYDQQQHLVMKLTMKNELALARVASEGQKHSFSLDIHEWAVKNNATIAKMYRVAETAHKGEKRKNVPRESPSTSSSKGSM